MPVTLRPLSRRDFLKRAALAGAAAALAPTSYAGLFGKSRDPHTVAFFSDTHIAADPTVTSRQVNMADNLRRCIQELAAWPVNPAAVIINGDLAFKDGQPGDYATFGQLTEPLRALAPLHLNLGNHDQREHFWQAFPHDAARQTSVPEKQCTVFSSPRANWFLLDSLEFTNSTPGNLGEAQFYWLSQELMKRPDKPAILVEHHNLRSAGFASGLKDFAAMDELLAAHPQVKALIFGHTHDWSLTRHATGVHLINLPPTGYVFTEGRPNGWVRVTLARDGMEVELRALDLEHPEHAQHQRLEWRA